MMSCQVSVTTPVRSPGVGTTLFAYDRAGRLLAKTDPLGRQSSLRYDAAGRVVEARDALGRQVWSRGPDASEREVAYTPAGFVDAVTIRVPGSAVEVLDQGGHDAVGNPATLASAEGPTTVTYDDLYRVKSADYPTAGHDESFTYDRAGNRILHVLNSQARTYVVDAGDQLTEIQGPAQIALERFTHDAAGRRTSREVVGGETTTYGYDAIGRLTSVSRPGYQMTLGYDAAGRRVRRTEQGATDRYLGELMIDRGTEVVRLLQGTRIDELVAEVTATGQVRAALFDTTANLTHVAIDGALEPSRRRYAAFGTVRLGSSAVENGFAGHAAEAQSGILYFRARHYDPATGSFLQSDPLGIDADQLYAYAASNPYLFTDPLGLDPARLSDLFGSVPPAFEGAIADQLGAFRDFVSEHGAATLTLSGALNTKAGVGAAVSITSDARFENFTVDVLGGAGIGFGWSLTGSLGFGGSRDVGFALSGTSAVDASRFRAEPGVFGALRVGEVSLSGAFGFGIGEGTGVAFGVSSPGFAVTRNQLLGFFR